jgi:hypothetical protein
MKKRRKSINEREEYAIVEINHFPFRPKAGTICSRVNRSVKVAKHHPHQTFTSIHLINMMSVLAQESPSSLL